MALRPALVPASRRGLLGALVLGAVLAIGCESASTIIDIAPGVVPPYSTDEAARAAMTVIDGSEAMLGRSLVPARIVKIGYHPDGTAGGGCQAWRLDGRPDAHGRGIGGEWIVWVEGTLVGNGAAIPGGMNAEVAMSSLATHGCIALEETRTGLRPANLLAIPCWTREPIDPSFMEGQCGPP